MTKNKTAYKRMTTQELVIIKSLIALIEGVIMFLKSENKILPEIFEDFNDNKRNFTRLLNSVEYHLPRYISNKQISSLLKMIKIGNDLIQFGKQQCSFLSNDILAMNFFILISKLKQNNIIS